MRTLSLHSILLVLLLFTSDNKTATCNFTPYRMPKCTSEECSRLCKSNFGENTENECTDFETCCGHDMPH
ncbi:hypothetical protein ACOSQ3_022277 [Xanthoceras sorbifolium]